MRTIAIFLVAALPALPASGTTFNFTGADLLAAPGASVTGTATPDGDAAIFSRQNQQVGFNEAIYRLELLPADPTRTDLRITLDVDYVALTADNDPGFFLADGTNRVGFGRVDMNGGEARFLERADAAGSNISLAGVAPTLGAVDPFTFAVTARAGSSANSATFEEGADSATVSFSTRPLDPRGPIAFVITGADPAERYQINSVSVTLAPVPLPAAGFGLLAAVAALALLGRGRRAA
ncbi:MAG: hypothetical protein ACFBRM_07515 [Pikeienuella sp.]